MNSLLKRALCASLLLMSPGAMAGGKGKTKAKAPARPTPDEVWAAESPRQNELLAAFRAAAGSDADAASTAATGYLTGEPRDPAVAREMMAWLSASQSVPAGDRAESLRARRREVMASIRAAIAPVEVHINDLDMIPGNIIPVFTFYETKRWNFSKLEGDECRLKVTGQLVSDSINVTDDEQEKLEPTKYEISFDWDLARQDPKALRISGGGALEAKSIQLHFGGERRVRATHPEYFQIAIGAESGFSFLGVDGLVFTDQSIARNVATSLLRLMVLCREKDAAMAQGTTGTSLRTVSVASKLAGERILDVAPAAVVGERWEYAGTWTADGKTQKSKSTRQVLEVGADSIRVRDEYQSGESETYGSITTLDPNWNTRSNIGLTEGSTPTVYEELPQDLVFPLASGMSWKKHVVYSFEMGGQRYPLTNDDEMEALGWESVTTPAGTFQSLKIRKKGRSDKYQQETTSWFVPEVKGVVREESTLDYTGSPRSVTVRELVKYELK